jgi:hypothetical protein
MEMGSKFEIIGNRTKYILNMARLNGFLKNEKIKNAQKTRKKHTQNKKPNGRGRVVCSEY